MCLIGVYGCGDSSKLVGLPYDWGDTVLQREIGS